MDAAIIITGSDDGGGGRCDSVTSVSTQGKCHTLRTHSHQQHLLNFSALRYRRQSEKTGGGQDSASMTSLLQKKKKKNKNPNSRATTLVTLGCLVRRRDNLRELPLPFPSVTRDNDKTENDEPSLTPAVIYGRQKPRPLRSALGEAGGASER